MVTQDATVAVVNEEAEVTPQARGGGVAQSLSLTTAGNVYNITFDINFENTMASDSLTAKIRPYSTSAGVGTDSVEMLVTGRHVRSLRRF